MSKFSKFVRNPGIFFRDYFIKKYPLYLDEQNHNFLDEKVLIENDFRLYDITVNDITQPIDVVITWVNNKDPNWIEKFEFYKKEKINAISPIAVDNARFEEHGELYYVIRSIQLYMPWVRNIFLVTDNQKPEFELPKGVQIINHCQIIDKKFLPTFNSHVIEAHLHNISQLSEDFIYFNDDVFVARYLPKSHFFTGNNISSLFLNKRNLDDMLRKGVMTPTLSACLNSRKLLFKKYKKNVNIPLVHTYIPLKKSYFTFAWSHFNFEIHSFISNRFRSENDLNLATFLVPWIMYFEQQSVLARDICYYFNIRSAFSNTNYNFLNIKKNNQSLPHSFCANDFLSQDDSSLKYKNNLVLFLKQFYT